MSFTHFRIETDADGVALVTWDSPGRSMNVLNAEVIGEIAKFVEEIAADPAIKGAVITSGKEGFSGGADLSMLAGTGAEYARIAKAQGEEAAMKAFYEGVLRLNLVFRKLETSGKSFAAAINGVCMGGGFELTLACHHRVLADHDKARVGLPEIKVGLFPGGGGTQRVSRLMPTPDALQMLAKGDQIKPAAAKKMGLVHEVAPLAEIVAKAKAWVLANPGAKAPWDKPDYKLPSGKVFSPTGMMIWPPANALYRRETYDNYPAARGDPVLRLRGPATADGPRAGGGEPLFRENPAHERGGGDDPLAVPVDGRAQQGRAAPRAGAGDEAEEGWRHRRRLHGRRRRLRQRQRRARRGAD